MPPARLVRPAADPEDLALPVPPGRGPRPAPWSCTRARKEPARRWPPERFAAVARELRRRGHPVVVTGSAAERPLAQRVAAAAGLPPEAVLAGRTPLRELCALVAGAHLVVSADTGIAHLATAYGTPLGGDLRPGAAVALGPAARPAVPPGALPRPGSRAR